MSQVQAVIAQRRFLLRPEEVEAQVRDVLPEPLGDHFVVISGRRFPPKQIIALVTGLDRADFNTHQARRILSRLGFTVGRRSRDRMSAPGHTESQTEAELLRPFAGRWVAQRGMEVLVDAETPQEVLAWLERHDRWADAMFRVPANEVEAGGSAPA